MKLLSSMKLSILKTKLENSLATRKALPKGDLNENSFNKLQKECLQSTANYTSNTDISSGYDDQTCGILAPAQGLRGFVSTH